MMRAAVVPHPIDFPGLVSEVAHDGNGATSIFLGTVRSDNDGKDVAGIEYSAYDAMATNEMTAILEETVERFGVDNAVVEHRVGNLNVGEISIAVVVATPHREASLSAVRYIIESIKSRAPIWKLEHYLDGTREWVNAGTGK